MVKDLFKKKQVSIVLCKTDFWLRCLLASKKAKIRYGM